MSGGTRGQRGLETNTGGRPRRSGRTTLALAAAMVVARYALADLEPDGRLASRAILGSHGGLVASITAGAGIDTRDRLHGTASGTYAAALIRLADRRIGSDYGFAQLTLDLRHYQRLPLRHVLAVQACGATGRGDIPFQALPRMGGASLMRGYLQALNRDRDLVAAQVEYRLPVWRRLGAVAFAGAGAVGAGLDDLLDDSLRFSRGAGLRFAVDRDRSFNLRADYGIGRRGSVLYLGAGEAF